MTAIPGAGSDVSTAELGRRLDELRSDVLRLGDKMDLSSSRVATGSDLQNLGIAWQASLDATEKRIEDHQTAQDGRLAKLEGWNEWCVRIVLGAVLIGVLGLVVANGGAL